MSDIALTWDVMEATGDVAVEANDLVRDDGLQTAVLLSLFTDRMAETSDQLPAGETDQRGWWADAVPVVAGDRMGSRLWLLAREKQSQATMDRAEKYAREALAWLLEDKVAERVEVAAEYPRGGMLALTVTIFRPRADPARFRFDQAWGVAPAPPAPLQPAIPQDTVTTNASDDFITADGGFIVTE